MKKNYFFLLLIPFAFSCTTVYQPSAVVAPVLEKKGDLEVQATARMVDLTTDLLSFSVTGVTVNMGFAYAVSNKMAGILNMEYQNEVNNHGPTLFSDNKTRNGYLGEFYVGKYFADSQTYNSSVFFGVGRGHRDLSL